MAVVDAAVSETPAVAAAPPAAPMASPTPVADAGIGSIEFRDTIPAAPDPVPEVVIAPVRPPVRAPARAPAPAESEVSAATDDVIVEGVIEPGEWLAASFRRRKLPGELAAVIAREIGDAFDFRLSQPGDRYRVTRTHAGEFVAFDYEPAGNDRLELSLVDGRYQLQRSLPR
jgi:hypothetical protein